MPNTRAHQEVTGFRAASVDFAQLAHDLHFSRMLCDLAALAGVNCLRASRPMHRPSDDPAAADLDEEVMRHDKDTIHRAFAVLRRQLAAVSESFWPQVRNQIALADPKLQSATLGGLLHRVIVETLNVGSRVASEIKLPTAEAPAEREDR